LPPRSAGLTCPADFLFAGFNALSDGSRKMRIPRPPPADHQLFWQSEARSRGRAFFFEKNFLRDKSLPSVLWVTAPVLPAQAVLI